MNQHQFLTEVQKILDDSRIAVLATIEPDGYPHMRWMVPAFVKERESAIYAITSKNLPKKMDLENNPKVEWMFQTKNMDRIVNIQGKINIVENPSLESEVMEALEKDLRTFWKLEISPHDMVVLETVMEKAIIYYPIKGEKLQIVLKKEES